MGSGRDFSLKLKAGRYCWPIRCSEQFCQIKSLFQPSSWQSWRDAWRPTCEVFSTDSVTPDPFVEAAAFPSISECWWIIFTRWPFVSFCLWPYLSVCACARRHAHICVNVQYVFTCTTAAACDFSSVFLDLCTVQLIRIPEEINMQQLAAGIPARVVSII